MVGLYKGGGFDLKVQSIAGQPVITGTYGRQKVEGRFRNVQGQTRFIASVGCCRKLDGAAQVFEDSIVVTVPGYTFRLVKQEEPKDGIIELY